MVNKSYINGMNLESFERNSFYASSFNSSYMSLIAYSESIIFSISPLIVFSFALIRSLICYGISILTTGLLHTIII